MAAKIIYSEIKPQVDSLGPDHVFVAFTGPFTGTRVPSSSRNHVAALSPQTGIFGESNVGGSWGVHFKNTGYDGLVITGQADHPVYLRINEMKGWKSEMPGPSGVRIPTGPPNG
jgi:aldehyde:ferredoxin oxidoreductase